MSSLLRRGCGLERHDCSWAVLGGSSHGEPPEPRGAGKGLRPERVSGKARCGRRMPHTVCHTSKDWDRSRIRWTLHRCCARPSTVVAPGTYHKSYMYMYMYMYMLLRECLVSREGESSSLIQHILDSR